MLKTQLKVGDVVVLNSGGEEMTVTDIRPGSEQGEVNVQCSWFEGPFGCQKREWATFPIEALKKSN